VVNTIRRKTNIIPQNVNNPESPNTQKPEIAAAEVVPNSFRQDKTDMTNRSLTPRKNSPEE
jgi:hypothetical protein